MILGVIEARLASKRLPKKALLKIGEFSAIEHCVMRLSKVKGIDHIVVATTIDESDRILADYLEEKGIDYFRGSSDDVLGRIAGAATAYQADAIFKIGADCPFLDIGLSEEVVDIWNNYNFDFVSNTIHRSYPDGYDVGILSIEALLKAERSAQDPLEREHTSLFIRRHINEFSHANLVNKIHFPPQLSVTLDTESDYIFLKTLELELGSSPYFGMKQVIDFTQRNLHILEIIDGIVRKGDT